MPTLSRTCRGALHSRKRPSLGRRLGAAPRFGADVPTSISAAYGGDRPRNPGLPAASEAAGCSRAYDTHMIHMIYVIGIGAIQPSGEAGSAGREPRVAATCGLTHIVKFATSAKRAGCLGELLAARVFAGIFRKQVADMASWRDDDIVLKITPAQLNLD
jgi:hypothetical protein